MKNIAIVGFGNHVVKNLIPAYGRSKAAKVDCILVRELSKYKKLSDQFKVPIFHANEADLSDIEWVHISTPISTHYELIKHYLYLGKNVICEKPICEKGYRTQELFELADKLNLKLCEVTMYKFHKQFLKAKKLINDNIKDIVSIDASFTIPHLDPSDIRYNSSLSGGALLDVGYYPISCLINLLGRPDATKYSIFSKPGYEVDLSGIAIFEYEHLYGTAKWAIGAPYTNQLIIETSTTKYLLPRFFSKPETLETSIEIQKGFESETELVGADDQFVNMIDSLLSENSIDENEYKNTTLLANQILTGLLDG